jgi:hypothetical protein
MTTKEELQHNVKEAEKALAYAQQQLFAFERSPDNFRYDSVDEATELEWDLRDQASEDCEGSYNVGADEYRQDCYIDGKLHTAILYAIEYNRHDKRYYFVDGSKFRIEDEAANVVYKDR